MLEIDNFKIFYTHGIYIYNPIIEKEETFIRNTEKEGREKKYIHLPLKLREALKKKWLEWFHVQKTIKWFSKRIKIGLLIGGKIEFTMGFCPYQHTMVITICHPYLDTFKRTEGIKWAKMRMDWALNNPHKKERWWLYRLKR